jgi:arylsulfatase A-like enzyme
VQPPKKWYDMVMTREPSIDPKRGKLVALIEHLDDGIGRVVKSLKETGQYENTLIFFVSDNGGNLDDLANNLPYRDGKQSMFEGGLKVPAFATWPAKIKEATVSNRQLLTMDIFPTLIDLVNGSNKENWDGKSFKQVLLETKAPFSERPVYFVRREGGIKYGGNDYHALIYQGWKILQNTPYSPLELYHINQDPYEKRNLAAEEPKRLEELNKLLLTYIQKGGEIPWQKPNKNE